MMLMVIFGQVLTGGYGQNPARQASIKAGIPIEKPAYIVNQVCGSGIRSVASGFQVLNHLILILLLQVGKKACR